MAENYKYHSFCRPIFIGTYPINGSFLDYSNFAKRQQVYHLNIMSFGYVEYSEKLSFEEIYNYELIPDNIREYVNYFFWEKSEKNIKEANRLKESYMRLSIEDLKEAKEKYHDINAMMVLRLKNL